MMRVMGLLMVGALALAGCASGVLRPTDTATMPLNADGGPALNQNEAIGLAGWALRNPANTAGKPGLAARAIAAEDWLAGQTTLYGNFNGWAPSGQPSWAALRAQVRAAIGVAPTASSQELVNRLIAMAGALKNGRTDAARAQLAAPIFGLGPDGTLAALAHLPPLPARDWAFADLTRNANPQGGAR